MTSVAVMKKVIPVEYSPKWDMYYIPSKSRGDTIALWEVFQSRRSGDWVCNCENFCITLDYKGECRHITLAKFYKKNKWAQKYMVIRVND